MENSFNINWRSKKQNQNHETKLWEEEGKFRFRRDEILNSAKMRKYFSDQRGLYLGNYQK